MDAELLALTDFLIVNETELALVAGKTVNESDIKSVVGAASTIVASGASNVIVTLGSNGAVAVGELLSKPAIIAGHSVDATDSTGAGDCFVGALAARHTISPKTFEDNLEYANAAAALSVTKPGAGPSMYTANEVETLLSRA